MPKAKIEEFGRKLVETVRDEAIRQLDWRLSGEKDNPVSKRWASEAEVRDPKDLIYSLVPDMVDETIFCLLKAIDQEIFPLCFKSSDGNTMDLSKDGQGELGGWYPAGEGGWVSRFSKERYIDYLSGLLSRPFVEPPSAE